MAGIYIHIPFCKQACTYCNFHFSTTGKNREQLIQALLKEIEIRKSYLNGEPIRSIYFGGGTPSMLSQKELASLFSQLEKHFDLSQLKEVTLEANPDDLNREKLSTLKTTPINRLSIGIQSFHEADLMFMNRAHKAEAGQRSIQDAQDAGFENLTIDLIYGVPGSNLKKWEENLQTFFKLKVPHLSSYALTLEENTAYAHRVKKGEIAAPNENDLADQYELLQVYIMQNDWEHYELSNYALKGNRALHNSSYWQGENYLGIGPSAHSFNGISRQWNVANNHLYTSANFLEDHYFEKETLSEKDRYHDALISRLRTKMGLSKSVLENEFSTEVLNHFYEKLAGLSSYIKEEKTVYGIKEEYWLTSDEIIRKLMID